MEHIFDRNFRRPATTCACAWLQGITALLLLANFLWVSPRASAAHVDWLACINANGGLCSQVHFFYPGVSHPIVIRVAPGTPDGAYSVLVYRDPPYTLSNGRPTYITVTFTIESGLATNISPASVQSITDPSPSRWTWEVVGFSGWNGGSATGRLTDTNGGEKFTPEAEFSAKYQEVVYDQIYITDPLYVDVYAGQPPPDLRPSQKWVWDDCSKQWTRVGMPRYAVDAFASLMIQDTPIFVDSAFGPKLPFTLNYRMTAPTVDRSSVQSANGFSHFGPNWSFNWLSYVTDTPGNSAAGADLFLDAGTETYRNFNTTTNSYSPERDEQTILKKTSADSYERVSPDGTVMTYSDSNGATAFPRRIFLTEVRDAFGKALSLSYDAGFRLSRITDATGRYLQLHYEDADNPGTGYTASYYLITKVSDGAGREALFAYEEEPYNGYTDRRLKNITDTAGLLSSFNYQPRWAVFPNSPTDPLVELITEMSTPYGTTKFKTSPVTTMVNRSMEIVDPNGGVERWQYIDTFISEMNGPGGQLHVEPPYPGAEFFAPDEVFNGGVNERSLYHWSKKAMADAGNRPPDFLEAESTHWLKSKDGSSTIPVPSSIKPPLEARTWMLYDGQLHPDWAGDSSKPNDILRIIVGGLQKWQKTYNLMGFPTEIIDPKGRTTSISYHSGDFDVDEVRQVTGVGTSALLAKYEDYVGHLPQKITDAAGQETQFEYTAHGQLEKVTNAKDEETKFAYVPQGTNGYGKLASVTRAFGTALAASHSFTYDAQHRLQTATDDEEAYTLTYGYDAIGGNPLKTLDRVASVTYPDLTTETVAYQRLDGRDFKDRLNRHTIVERDGLQQVTSVTDPQNRTVTYEWCECGSLEKIKDGENHETEWERDLQYRVTGKRIAGQTVATYEYEPMSGRLAKVIDALGQITTYSYDMDDNLLSVVYTDEVHATPNVAFGYGSIFNRLETITSGAEVTTYGYVPFNPSDAVYGDGQLASVDGPLTADTLNYGYDILGRMTSGPRQVATEIDALGRLKEFTNGLGTFTQEWVGKTARLDWRTLPNGQKMDLDWHPASLDLRLKQIKNLDPVGTPISQFDYQWDAAARMSRWTQWHSGLGTGAARRWEPGYNGADELTSVTVKNDVTEAVLPGYGYGYDDAGNRTSATYNGTGPTWTPNAKNQLTGTTAGGGVTRVTGTVSEAATVKVNGQHATVFPPVSGSVRNWETHLLLAPGLNEFPIEATETSVAAGFNPQKTTKTLRITSAAATYAYDDNGNLTGDGGTRTFEWDAANRLVAVNYVGTARRSEFSYDGLSRRSRMIEKDGTTVLGDRRYIWDGMEEYEERDSGSSGTFKRYFADGFFWSDKGNSQPGAVFYTFDHLGNIRELTTTGAPVARFDYDAYGIRSKISGGTWAYQLPPPNNHIGGNGEYDSDLGFTGHWYHASSGLHLAPYRAYDAGLGRWLSRDPIEEEGGLNLYGYAFNDSFNNIDPFGLSVVGKVIVFVATGAAKGYKTIKALSNVQEAASAVRAGEDVIMNTRKLARQTAREAGEGAQPIHEIDAATGARHYHTASRSGGHVLYSAAAALTLAGNLDAEAGTIERGSAFILDLLNPLSLPQDVLDIYDVFKGVGGCH